MVSIANSHIFLGFLCRERESLQLSSTVSYNSDGMSVTLKATNENLPPNVIRQLAKELKNLDESPPEGINVIVNDDDFTTIFADIEGPGNILSRCFGLLSNIFWPSSIKFACLKQLCRSCCVPTLHTWVSFAIPRLSSFSSIIV